MAPVQVAGRRWTRDTIINAIQEWVALYGEPPRAADWNPSSAKWSGQIWRVERYRAGRPDGSSWPALNAAKRPFGGSLNEAVRAAGFEPAKPGPKRRSDVDPEQADRVQMSPEARAMIAAALHRARQAERRVETLDAQLARVRERAVNLANAKPKVATKTVRELMRVEVPVRDDELRMDLAQARRDASRLAARLERAEADKATLRAAKRELAAAATRADARVAAAERAADAAEDRAVAAERLAQRAPVVIREEAPEDAAARVAARDAELRAARFERGYLALAAAVSGERRRLSAAELDALRRRGPAGPGLVAEAIKSLAAARAANNPTRLHAALTDLASAAVMWRDRVG